MNSLERLLIECGANILFKEAKPEKPKKPKVGKWKLPLVNKPPERKACPAQRIVAGIPRDPVDRTAAIVTSKKPKDS